MRKQSRVVMRAIVTSILLMLVMGCSNNDDGMPDGAEKPSGPSTNPEVEIRTLQVRDHRQECIGVAIFPCLYVKAPDETSWSYFYDSIDGFDYEWGYNYELEVSVTPVANPPADGSSLRYALINTISKIPVATGSSFTYFSRFAAEVITKKADNRYALFNFESREFVCDSSECDMLDALLSQGKSIAFQFRHPDDLAGDLILERLVCSANMESFNETCMQSQSEQENELSVDLSILDKFDQTSNAFTQGEPITFTFSITNNSANTVTLEFASGQRFDLFIRSESGEELWRWSDGLAFTQAIEHQDIAAMETIQITETWDQTLKDGSQLAPGSYIASGYYHDSAKRIEVAFSVQ